MSGAHCKSTALSLNSGPNLSLTSPSAGVNVAAIFGFPVAIVILILCVSPNFDATNRIRIAPLGSDFLQDWVGAYIVSSPDRAQLYDPDHSKLIQHDPSVVGFQWPRESYYPMVYPPFFYAALTPLANLPYWIAIWFWMFLLAGATGLTFWLLKQFFPPARRHFGKYMLAAMVFAPLLSSINLGQKSVLMLLILSATYVLLFNRRPMTAGLVFGLIAFKPHIGLVIAMAMLAKRQWSFVAGSTMTVAALVGMSLMVGTDVSFVYFQQCLGMGDYIQTHGYELNQAIGLWGATSLSLPTCSTTVVKLVVLGEALLVASVVCWSIRGPVDTASPIFALQFSSLVLATPLLSPHFYVYDLTIVLLPLMLIANVLSADNAFKLQIEPGARTAMLCGCVLLLALAGLFPGIADATGVQPAVVIITGLLMAVGVAVQRPARDRLPADELLIGK